MYVWANNVFCDLAASVAIGASSITVNGASAPNNSPPDPGADKALLSLADRRVDPTKREIVSYTGRTDNGDGTYTLTGVSKGLEGTADQAWSDGDYCFQDLTAGSAPVSPVVGRKNLIINGNFDVWQRGTSFSSAGYTADRWRVAPVDATFSVTQQAFTPGQTDVPGEPRYFYRNTVSVAATLGSCILAQQRIEDVRRTAGRDLTISFYHRSDDSDTYWFAIEQNFGAGGSSSVFTYPSAQINSTTSWAKKEETFSIPSISGKTIGAGSYLALWIYQNGPYFTCQFDLAQVQAEIGSEATDFEYRPIAEELALCQRYYQKSVGSNNGSCTFFSGDTVSSKWYYAGRSFQVEMRTAPTITLANFNAYGFLSTAGSVTDTSAQGFLEARQSNVTTNGAYFSSDWTADAEL